MCYKVKEGDYPPPMPKEECPGFFKTYGVFFRECLQIPIYRNFFITALLVTAAMNCAGNFVTLFADDAVVQKWDHRPGQFVELSVIGTGEAPISISPARSRIR